MKVIMQEDGAVSYNGRDVTKYRKGVDVSNIPKHARDYFIKVKKAKEIVEKAKAEKAESKKTAEKKAEETKKVSTKKKSVKVEENKMVKDIENK